MPTLYLETSVPSYLTAWLARDVIAAARQVITRQWWELDRHRFQLFISRLVIEEASAGDPEAARLRLEALRGIPLLGSSPAVEWIVTELDRRHLVPSAAVADMFHIALASVHAVDYLLTWNCRPFCQCPPAARDRGFPGRQRFFRPRRLHTGRAHG